MRILVFHWRDIKNPWRGGAEINLHETAKRLIAQGHDVTLLTGGFPLHQKALKYEVIDQVKVYRYGGTYSYHLIAPLVYYLKFRGKFDLVLDIEHGIPSFTPLFVKEPIVCFVHHIHSRLFMSEFSLPIAITGGMVERNLVPILYRHVPTVAVSVSSGAVLEELGFKNIKIIIHHGVNKPYFIIKYHKKFSQPTVLYLGRLRKYKRVDMLIDMVKELKKRIPQVQLIIAGGGHEEEAIKQKIRREKLISYVKLLSVVSEDKKLELLQRSHVLAMPSEVEGWGLVTTEAAASGLPSVAFRVPGLVESVKEGVSGTLADTKEEFVEALYRYLEDTDYRMKISKSAPGWAKNFTWDKATEELLLWIKQVYHLE